MHYNEHQLGAGKCVWASHVNLGWVSGTVCVRTSMEGEWNMQEDATAYHEAASGEELFTFDSGETSVCAKHQCS